MRNDSRRWLVPVALLAGAALISGFTILRGVDPFDEGLVLQAARRVSQGQLPYRDLLWSYGPAHPYLLAALFKLLGVSLLPWRVLWMLANAGTALVAWLLVRPRAGGGWALAAWLAVACAMAQPRTANPFPFALLAALCAVLVATGEGPARTRALRAGLLVALAAAFRLDFALYGLAAVLVMLALDTRRPRALLACAVAAVGGALLVYLPFGIADGPGHLYDALVGTSLREREYWTLPFPWSYDGSVTSATGLKHLLDFYVPALLLAGLAVGGVAAVLRAVRERRAPAVWAGVLVFGLGGVSYLLSRTDDFHTTPLIVLLAVLLPLVAAWALRERPPQGLPLAAAATLVFALLLAHGVANRASALFQPPPTSEVHVGPADGARAAPAEARALERVVALVHRRVPPGGSIYVAPARSDLVRFTDPLLYVLAERDNATDRDHGLIARAGTQRRIVTQLARARPRAIVRWTDPLGDRREPNLRGRPSGVRLLDAWLAGNYRLEARLYHYDVLVPR
ncbi:MAG: hypothetical protein QOD53_625 [Thermoleophilaceae bacterium]|jgi:hypothetical protein|nr:hypothetical protein [Thermoleophilaceae bacterium]